MTHREEAQERVESSGEAPDYALQMGKVGTLRLEKHFSYNGISPETLKSSNVSNICFGVRDNRSKYKEVRTSNSITTAVHFRKAAFGQKR